MEFDSIGGLQKIKHSLFELVILPLQRPELFSYGKLLGPQKGVLLYGPPGTGKTLLAKAIAKESGSVFINVRMSNLMSKWFGDAQKLGKRSLCIHLLIVFILVIFYLFMGDWKAELLKLFYSLFVVAFESNVMIKFG